jgi:hypothetical protein
MRPSGLRTDVDPAPSHPAHPVTYGSRARAMAGAARASRSRGASTPLSSSGPTTVTSKSFSLSHSSSCGFLSLTSPPSARSLRD